MRRRVLVGLAAVAAATLAALAAAPALRSLGGGGATPTVEVRRGPFVRRIQAEGNLKAVQATPLTPPSEATGPLKIAWIAEDGTRVAPGDVVIRFDPTAMETGLADGKAERDTAQRRIEGRRAEGAGTAENLRRDSEMADLELSYAREFQSKDPLIFSRVAIIESEIDESLATRRKENAQAVREIRERLTKVDLDLLAIERRKAELKIGLAEKGLQALEVRAPHEGILVLKREWRGVPKVGDTVWKGQVLAEIPRLDALEADVYVLEADAGGLAVGRAAEVALEAHPGLVVRGKIKKVDALAKPRVNWIPVQYFGVTVELEKTDPAVMKPGQRVQAALVLDERPDALSVPRAAVLEKDGKKIVYRKRSFGFDPVEVELGPAALGRVVVEKGLQEGDRIALRDPTRTAEEPAQPAGGTASPPSVTGSGS